MAFLDEMDRPEDPAVYAQGLRDAPRNRPGPDTSEAIEKIAAALARAQGSFTAVARSAKNPHFSSRYSPMDAVAAMLRKPFLENGLCWFQAFRQTPDRADWITVVTTIAHESGQWIRSELAMRIVPKLSREKIDAMVQKGVSISEAITMHDIAGAITYARRNALMATAGIVAEGEDDDGNRGSGVDREGRRPSGGRARGEETLGGGTSPRAGWSEKATAFLAENPGLEQLLQVPHPDVQDIRKKLAKFGSLSEKQIAYIERLAKEHEGRVTAETPGTEYLEESMEPPAFRPSMEEGKQMLDLVKFIGVETYRAPGPKGEDGPRHLILPAKLAKACGWEAPPNSAGYDMIPSTLDEPSWRQMMSVLTTEAERLRLLAQTSTIADHDSEKLPF